MTASKDYCMFQTYKSHMVHTDERYMMKPVLFEGARQAFLSEKLPSHQPPNQKFFQVPFCCESKTLKACLCHALCTGVCF